MSEGISDFDSDYSVKGQIHEIVEKYNPAYLARGSESLVYVPNREGREWVTVVFKVDILSVAHCVMSLEENPELTLDEFEKQKVEMYTERKKRKQEANIEAASYLGRESVPVERTFFCRVPATPVLLEKAMSHYEKSNYNHNEVMAQVTMQTFRIEAFDPDSPAISCGHLEIEQPIDGLDVLQHKLVHRPEGSVLTEKEKEIIFFEPTFRNLLERIHESKEVAKCVSDFVVNAMAYTNETGKILDFVGGGNVVLVEDDDPRLVVIDGIYLSDVNQIEKAKSLVLKSFAEGLDSEELSSLIVVLGHVRTLNVLASVLSIPDRLSIFDTVEALDDDEVSTNYGGSLITEYRKQAG